MEDPSLVGILGGMSLDPYRQWLEISDDGRPPNYYALLGLAGPQASSAEIEAAYAKRMQTVRRYQVGAHMDLAQRLISELSEAYVCLSDPDKKQEYDAALRGQRTVEVSAPAMTTVESHAASLAVLPAGWWPWTPRVRSTLGTRTANSWPRAIRV